MSEKGSVNVFSLRARMPLQVSQEGGRKGAKISSIGQRLQVNFFINCPQCYLWHLLLIFTWLLPRKIVVEVKVYRLNVCTASTNILDYQTFTCEISISQIDGFDRWYFWLVSIVGLQFISVNQPSDVTSGWQPAHHGTEAIQALHCSRRWHRCWY